MADQNPIIWTPFQRQSVIDFLKQYTSKLEAEKDDPSQDFGLSGIQGGVLHVADKVLPSGVVYVVNQGPNSSIRDNVKVIFTDEEQSKFEEARSGEGNPSEE
jgi:hypothetical protein